jgi:gas vesicle protein
MDIVQLFLPDMLDKKNTQHEQSVRDKLEQLRTIASQVKNPNISSVINNTLGEVKQLLDSNNPEDINHINAKLDYGTVANLIS